MPDPRVRPGRRPPVPVHGFPRSAGRSGAVPRRSARRRRRHRPTAREGLGGRGRDPAAGGVRRRRAPPRPALRGERPGRRRPGRRGAPSCISGRTTCRSRSRGASSATHRSSDARPTTPRSSMPPTSRPASTTSAPGRPGRRRPSPAARPPALGLIDHAARVAARPWFAIGGIESLDRLDEVIAHGARRVVVVRAITEADDPAAATRAFAERLRAMV